MPILLLGFDNPPTGNEFALDLVSPACDIQIDLPDETHLCEAGDYYLCADVNVSNAQLEILWLENGQSTNYDLCEDITVEEETEFTLVVTYTDDNNLIINGDFENGDDGSFTTIYEEALTNCTSHSSGYLGCEGVYIVDDDPSDGHSNFDPCSDHSFGSGNMMIVNGAASLLEIWCQEVCVDPTSSYLFSAWASSVNPGSPAELQFSIDGNLIGSVFDLTSSTCQWEQFETEWEANGETSVEICVTNQNTAAGGNDFALDDIEFYQVCEEEASFLVTVSDMELNLPEVDPVNCINDEVEITLEIIPAQIYNDIIWDTSDGDIEDEDYETIIVSAGGTYEVTVTDIYDCEFSTAVYVEENFSEPTVTILGGSHLNCDTTTILLTGMTNATDPQYHWLSASGATLGTANKLSVSAAGEIELLVIDAESGCENSEEIELTLDTLGPSFKLIKSNDLNCHLSVSQINTSSPMDSVIWTTNNGNTISSNNDTITVTDAGEYYAQSTFPNGCLHIDTVEVILTEATFSYLSDYQDSINCTSPNSTVDILFDPNLYNINWQGIAAPYSNQASIQLSQAGTYTYELSDTIGCSIMDSVTIAEDFTEPTFTISATEISCAFPQAVLSATDPLGHLEISWQLPDGSTLTGDEVLSTQAGSVYVRAVSPNGCYKLDTVLITESNDFPTAEIFGDTLTCTKNSIRLSMQTSPDVSSFIWKLPDGSEELSAAFETELAGLYLLEVTNNSGCSSTTRYNVEQNISEPELKLVWSDTIDCSTTTVRPEVIISSPFSSAKWTGQGIEIDSLNLHTSIPGIYKLEITGENGCKIASIIKIEIDTMPPEFSISPPELLNCSNEDFLSQISHNQSDELKFSWETPSGQIIDRTNILISEPGLYTLTATGRNGCTSTETMNVLQDADRPIFSSTATEIRCDSDTVQVNSDSTDPSLTFQYFDPLTDTELGTGSTLTVVNLESVRIVATDANGCTALQNLSFSYDTIAPIIIASASGLGCAVSSVQVSLESTDILNNIIIYNSQGDILGDQDFLITIANNYLVSAKSTNGCISIEPFEVTIDSSTISFGLESEFLDCYKTKAAIEIISGESFQSAELLNSNGVVLETIVNTNTFEGAELADIYTVIVTAHNGCTSLREVEILSDDAQISFFLEAENLTCSNESTTIDILTADTYTDGYAIHVASQELIELNSLQVFAPGLYEVHLIGSNGCESVETIEVLELIDIPALNNLNAETLSCDGKGRIYDFDITGGMAPYSLSIDNSPVSLNSDFIPIDGLGEHEIVVIDANGCLSKHSFSLDPVLPVIGYIAPQIQLIQESDRQLQLELNKPLEEIAKISWSPQIDLSCYDCLDPTFTGDSSTIYKINVRDIFDCETELQIRLDITIPFRVYIPNILDLTRSTDNKFNIFTSEEVLITELSIYDRWGNLVFINNNFMANDLTAGWDGYFNNKRVLPGVYVYYAVLLRPEGEPDIYAGDLTVIR